MAGSSPLLVALVAFIALIVDTTGARALKLATWNFESLADAGDKGCKPRTDADYKLLKQYGERLAADVVAVQGVENEQALAKVFDPALWSLEISRRPAANSNPPCSIPGRTSITEQVGFAIRRNLPYTRNLDQTALDIGGQNKLSQGVDITLEAGPPLRLMTVHLQIGCLSDPADSSKDQCKTLFQQQRVLKEWVAQRAIDRIPFLILGDFSRALRTDDAFWLGLDDPSDAQRDLTLPAAPDGPLLCRKTDPQSDFVVFNTPSLRFYRNNSLGILRYDGDEGTFPSNHCPLFAELDVPDMKDLGQVDDLVKKEGQGRQTVGLKWYRRSAEFSLIARYIYDQAARRVDAIKKELGAENWVVSLDGDETIFDNSLGQLETEYLGLGYSEERWDRWEDRASAKAVPGAVTFMNHVLRSGGKIVVITNRDAKHDGRTRQNLVRLGVDDDPRNVCVLGRSDPDKRDKNPTEWQLYGYKNDKDRRRRLVREGSAAGCWLTYEASVKASWNAPHRIALSIGDNVQDFPLATQADARSVGIPGLTFGRDYFLLPNPLYGSWSNNPP